MAAVQPRLASSVILVRPRPVPSADAVQGFEVFMVRRPVRSEFAADVYVFPGGSIRSDDADPQSDIQCAPFAPHEALRLLSERGGNPPASEREAMALWLAALRELFEEAGVLLAEPRTSQGGAWLPGSRSDRLGFARVAIQAGRHSLRALAKTEELRLACEQLVYFSHWVTPVGMPRRYDTRFFLAVMPPDQQAIHCAIETVAGTWVAPGTALERSSQGDFPLVFVTQRHLERLAGFATLEALLSFAREKGILSIQPSIWQGGEPWLPAEVEGCW